jgi:predicted RNase H-like HicB family nuclease
MIKYSSALSKNRTMFKYEIIIFWDNKDKCYIADVPKLAGCKAHGSSYDNALTNAQEAIALWTDTAKDFGDAIPQPKGSRLFYA